MKIALAQYNYFIGDFEYNQQKIIKGIEKARAEKADLVVFAELAVCGYPSGDLLEFDDYIDKCYESVNKIASHCKNIAAVVGAPLRNNEPAGKPLYNVAFFLEDGQIKHVYKKGLLPDYSIFDEYRYFEPETQFNIIPFKGKRLAITVCEDIWNLTDKPLYEVNPLDVLIKQDPDFIVNIAASPFAWQRTNERRDMFSRNAIRYNLPLFYVNQVGAQTELVFDGGSMVINSSGEVVDELKSFEEDFRVYDLEKVNQASGQRPVNIPDKTHKLQNIYEALVLGVKDYFKKMGFNKAILGLSGGIDSALTMVIAADALGAENVLGVLMPGEYSSDHSINDARVLAENLGCPWQQISITESSKLFEKNLQPFFKDLPFGVAEENIQARTRAIYLMALSNKFGYMLLNTSNKSEAAVGYGTLYGDMCGGLSVIGDVYKTEVFELSRYINRKGEIIPENTILKPPSAELRPNQKDSDSLPDYDILDNILYLYLEEQKGARQIINSGFDPSLVKRVLKLVNNSEYKRYQTSPVLRVSSKAFGVGRKMPIVARYDF